MACNIWIGKLPRSGEDILVTTSRQVCQCFNEVVEKFHGGNIGSAKFHRGCLFHSREIGFGSVKIFGKCFCCKFVEDLWLWFVLELVLGEDLVATGNRGYKDFFTNKQRKSGNPLVFILFGFGKESFCRYLLCEFLMASRKLLLKKKNMCVISFENPEEICFSFNFPSTV